jgi:hypothetical protein
MYKMYKKPRSIFGEYSGIAFWGKPWYNKTMEEGNKEGWPGGRPTVKRWASKAGR